jgi:tetratricopeptide (TPR) repeat protein
MKRILPLFLFLMIGALSLNAQDDAKKMMRKADRALARYNIDQSANKDDLDKAKDLINQAVKDSEYSKVAEAWVIKGQVYDAYANMDLKTQITNPNAAPQYPDAPYVSYDAYMNAMQYAEKSRYKNDALDGLKNVAQFMSMEGNAYLSTQEYDKAYKPLDKLLAIHQIMVRNDEDPVFQSEADFNQQKYVVSVCAAQAGDAERSKELLVELYEKSYEQSAVYSMLFDMYNKEGNTEKAAEVLNKGKELFPDDSQLLFAQINYYIQNEKYDELEASLKQAIAAEPNNASVRSALGNVYTKLFNDNLEAGNEEDALKYKAQAIDYYEQALEIEPESFDALYSVGSIYFNEAATLTQQMGELGMSKEDQKKYDELKETTEKLFNTALPYFKKAERINPGDQGMLIALKEIYARTGDFETSNEFKKRLEKVQGGGEVTESYFNAQGN